MKRNGTPPKIVCPSCDGTGKVTLGHVMNETLQAVKTLKTASAPDIKKRLDADNELTISTFNNRLSHLESLGLLKRTKVSGMWIYAAV